MTKIGKELETARPVLAREREEISDEVDDAIIDELNAEMAHLQQLAELARRVKRRHARVCAAIAQTDAEYFRIMCKLMDPLAETCPDHPMIQQWLHVRAVWEEQLLKQN